MNLQDVAYLSLKIGFPQLLRPVDRQIISPLDNCFVNRKAERARDL
jgi:hypothetical protein